MMKTQGLTLVTSTLSLDYKDKEGTAVSLDDATLNRLSIFGQQRTVEYSICDEASKELRKVL